MNLDLIPTERLEAELADRWARRQGAPERAEVDRMITTMSRLLHEARDPAKGPAVVLVVPVRSDTPRLLRVMAEELESPPEHGFLRRVQFRDLADGDL